MCLFDGGRSRTQVNQGEDPGDAGGGVGQDRDRRYVETEYDTSPTWARLNRNKTFHLGHPCSLPPDLALEGSISPLEMVRRWEVELERLAPEVTKMPGALSLVRYFATLGLPQASGRRMRPRTMGSRFLGAWGHVWLRGSVRRVGRATAGSLGRAVWPLVPGLCVLVYGIPSEAGSDAIRAGHISRGFALVRRGRGRQVLST
jgi:hypothetical protein